MGLLGQPCTRNCIFYPGLSGITYNLPVACKIVLPTPIWFQSLTNQYNAIYTTILGALAFRSHFITHTHSLSLSLSLSLSGSLSLAPQNLWITYAGTVWRHIRRPRPLYLFPINVLVVLYVYSCCISIKIQLFLLTHIGLLKPVDIKWLAS